MPLAKALHILLMTLLAGCVPSPTDTSDADLPEADLRVLFVGNSLTYVNDVPGLVQSLADAAGLSMSHAVMARANYSLEEHWGSGIAGEIERLRPDVVVMQQGPSSLAESREHLVYWASRLGPVIRGAGGVPAFYMVWPDESRKAFFDEVRDSYAAAAEAVDGMLIPAGVTWLEAWERDASLELYGPDRFHAAYLGSLAAAETIYAMLFDATAGDIPELDDGVPAATRAILAEAVGASVGEWGRR